MSDTPDDFKHSKGKNTGSRDVKHLKVITPNDQNLEGGQADLVANHSLGHTQDKTAADNLDEGRLDDDSLVTEIETEAISKAELLTRLETLKTEHRRIDVEIQALIDLGAIDMLKIGRMKKVKLFIKDQIRHVENQITPDIIA